MPEQQETATRSSWKTLPLPDQSVKLHFERDFTEIEYKQMSLGLIPSTMEDKWFIFLENEIMFFHRSWTGACIYQMHFINSNNQYSVDDVWVNRNSEQYKELDNDYDIKLLNFLIDNFLLGLNTPFPIPSNIPDLPKSLYQHNVSGTGYREKLHLSEENWVVKLKRIFSKRK
jgi:hypothetical protein